MTIYRALELGEEDAGQRAPFPASVLGIYSCHGAEPGWEEGEEVITAGMGYMGWGGIEYDKRFNGIIFCEILLLHGWNVVGCGGMSWDRVSVRIYCMKRDNILWSNTVRDGMINERMSCALVTHWASSAGCTMVSPCV